MYSLNDNLNIPRSSTPSCRQYSNVLCNHLCNPGYCRQCCINSMVDDHTYCVLKNLCRKIINDLNREQCRERYTIFDGGNSMNARLYRSSTTSCHTSQTRASRLSAIDICQSIDDQNELYVRGRRSKIGGKYKGAGDCDFDGEEFEKRKRRSKSKRRGSCDDDSDDYGSKRKRKSKSRRRGDDDDDDERGRKGKSKRRRRGSEDDEDESGRKKKRRSKKRRGSDDEDDEGGKGKGKKKNGKKRKKGDDDDEDDDGKGKSKKGKKRRKDGDDDDDDDDADRKGKGKGKGKKKHDDDDASGAGKKKGKKGAGDDDDEDGGSGKRSGKGKGKKGADDYGDEESDAARKGKGKKPGGEKDGDHDGEGAGRRGLDKSKKGRAGDESELDEMDKKRLLRKTKAGDMDDILERGKDGADKYKRGIGRSADGDYEDGMRRTDLPIISDLRTKVRRGEEVEPDILRSGKALSETDAYLKKMCADKKRSKRSRYSKRCLGFKDVQSTKSRCDEVNICDFLRAHLEQRELIGEMKRCCCCCECPKYNCAMYCCSC